MNQFDKILQKLDVKIQNLSKNGENNNGKIDTTNEKDQLAKLLAGAEQEMDDLYSNVYYGNKDDNGTASVTKEKNYIKQKIYFLK